MDGDSCSAYKLAPSKCTLGTVKESQHHKTVYLRSNLQENRKHTNNYFKGL